MKAAFADGGITSISLTPKEFSSFKELSTFILGICSKPLRVPKNSAGYFIRGGDLELIKSHTTTGGIVYTDSYLRLDKGLKSASLLILDVDNGPNSIAPTLQEVSTSLKRLGYSHFGYTTSSHTVEKPKCRIVIPCDLPSKAYLAPTIQALKALLSEVSCFPLASGQEERVWSNAWFFPVYHENSFALSWIGKDFIPVSPITVNIQKSAPQPSSKILSLVKIVQAGIAGTGLHEATNKIASGQVMDGIPPATAIAMTRGLMSSYSGTPRQIENYNAVQRMVDNTVNNNKAKLAEWTDPLPMPSSYELYKEVQFPTQWMPESMMKAAQEIADFNLMSVHDVIPALIICNNMSINKKAKVQAGSKSIESYFHLTAFFIAKSGRFKSGVYDQVLAGLVKANKELVDKFNKEEPRVQMTIKAIGKAISKAENMAVKSQDDSPVSLSDILNKLSDSNELVDELDRLENRRIPGMFVDDITEEGAVDKAFKAGGVINYVAEEGQGILSAWTNKYNKSESGTDFALRGMSGSMYRHDRKGSDRSLEFRPVASGMIFVQPDIYETQFINNSNINSSGMAARILPIYWKEPDYKNTKKTRKNNEIDKTKLQEYWDTIYKLAMFTDEGRDFRYETDDMESPQLIKPCTKICINDNHIDKYNSLFNKYWHKYAEGEEHEGKQELLNKCNTLAYIIAGGIYAYNNVDTFFYEKVHQMDTLFFNCVASITEYLVQKKSVEFKLKTHAVRVKGAKKVLKTLTSPANIELSLAGISVSVFHRMTNYRRPKTDTTLIDEGQVQLMELGYLRVDGDKLVLNPKYEGFIDKC